MPPAADRFAASPRVVAHLRGEAAGPMLIVIGGLHGNEPSGLEAMRRVSVALATGPVPVRGDLLMLAGNMAALERGVRFIDRDLNRGWTDERLAALRTNGARDAEDGEQLELADALETALASARGPSYLLDLHATSAEGIPFSLCADAHGPRCFAGGFPVTLVLGLIDVLSSTLAGYYGNRCSAVVVEGGQNANPVTGRIHEGAIWLALAAAGLVEERDVPPLEEHRQTLTRARGDLPRVVHVHHRHAIAPEDRFRMEPGYANIQRVQANELLAHDRRGEIRAREPGFILMPLYQSMGDDGFFLGREEAEEARAG